MKIIQKQLQNFNQYEIFPLALNFWLNFGCVGLVKLKCVVERKRNVKSLKLKFIKFSIK